MARATLPEDLVLRPGPASRVEQLARQRALLEQVEADERALARAYARKMRHCAELAQAAGQRLGQTAMELAGTSRVGQDRATRDLVDGLRLTECFPRALELLAEGQMHVGSVHMLLGMTKSLTAELQAEVGDRVCEQIASLDAADARQLIARTIAEVQDAEQARAAHERARAQRGVWVKPVEDGMARIGAEVDQLSAHRFVLDFEEIDRAQKLHDLRTGRQRTTQQRRADLLVELPSRYLHLVQALQRGEADALRAQAEGLWHASVSAPRTPTEADVARHQPLADDELLTALLSVPVRNPTTMHLHTPMTTALDLDNRACVVEGLGLVPAFQARLLRPVARLARLWVDASTGTPLGMDPDTEPPPDPELDPQQAAELVRQRLRDMLRPTAIRDEAEPRHDPSRRLRRLVEVRDVRCDGPGCPMPAHRCELDHEHDWADGGVTAVWNLKARSPRCHHGKHDGWTVEHHPDGSSTWTSPTGRTYHRRSAWCPPTLPPVDADGDVVLPPPRPDTLDDTDPREDWNLPLWRGDEPPGF